MSQISILFCNEDSIYDTLNVATYKKSNDYTNFPGQTSIIAHPPCQQWSRMRSFSKPCIKDKILAPIALAFVRKYGGVLEHPNGSLLWKIMNINRSSKVDKYGGYTISVDQKWWGHPCKKSTLLYIVGCPIKDLPIMPISFDATEYSIGNSNKSIKEIPKAKRSNTPVRFARWLIQVAEICNENTRQ